MVPGDLVFLQEIPLTKNGKIDYQALSEIPAEGADRSKASPRDTVELELVQLWQELLGVEEVGIDDGFFELGGHSLLAVQLMAAIHTRFGRQLGLATLFEQGTVGGLADLIRAEGWVPSPQPLVPIQPHGEGPPSFFVHPAGGNVLSYYELSQGLGKEAPFWGLQAVPGGPESLRPQSISAMAREYLDALLEVAEDRTPFIGGWSMGALVALEMGRLFAEERGVAPTVVVLDQMAPAESPAQDDEPTDELSRLLLFSGKVSELLGSDLGVSEEALAGRSVLEQAEVFLVRFKAHQLVPEATEVEDFQHFLRLMLEHNRITGEYAPAKYPGKILVFRARERVGEVPPDLGWQRLSDQPVEVVEVPGSHVSMMRAPHVQLLAEALRERTVDHSGGASDFDSPSSPP